jgi:hypothetical protein
LSGIGKPLTGKQIVPWSDIVLYAASPSVRRDQLYLNYPDLKTANLTEVRTRLRRYLRLPSATSALTIPTRVGDVVVDERLVAHPLDPAFITRRYDADHLRFWPLTLPTLREPIEIIEFPAEPRTNDSPAKPRRYYFLAVYDLGDARETHLVVVHFASRQCITSLRLENPSARLDKKRQWGTLHHSVLAGSREN